MLNLLQKNKSFENIRISFFAMKFFQKIIGYENVLTRRLRYVELFFYIIMIYIKRIK